LRAAYEGARSSSDVSVEAYLATRMPATFAAISRVFELVAEVAPDFMPKSLLDVGAGPGTASWAAVEAWPGLGKVTLVERDSRFADMAAEFLKASSHAALNSANVERADMAKPARKAELVVAAYVFAEQRETMARELALRLWEACEGLLIIVEPGTPDGFARIRAARHALLQAGAFMVAPCPHSDQCPMVGDDWCHFKTRLQRSRLHMQAKGVTVPFEDESFSFIAVSRQKRDLPQGRILSPPAVNKVGTSLKLCGHGGVEQLVIASRDKAAYKLSKKKSWGDVWG
jgi:ribosomal protein RSM22 (predicted rRNA methylase)